MISSITLGDNVTETYLEEQESNLFRQAERISSIKKFPGSPPARHKVMHSSYFDKIEKNTAKGRRNNDYQFQFYKRQIGPSENVQSYQPFNMTERDYDSIKTTSKMDLNETVEIKINGRPTGLSGSNQKLATNGSNHFSRPAKNNFTPDHS